MDKKKDSIDELTSIIDEIQAIASDVVSSISGVGEEKCYDSLMNVKKLYEKMKKELEKEM